jgi:hypothetical protein
MAGNFCGKKIVVRNSRFSAGEAGSVVAGGTQAPVVPRRGDGSAGDGGAVRARAEAAFTCGGDDDERCARAASRAGATVALGAVHRGRRGGSRPAAGHDDECGDRPERIVSDRPPPATPQSSRLMSRGSTSPGRERVQSDELSPWPASVTSPTASCAPIAAVCGRLVALRMVYRPDGTLSKRYVPWSSVTVVSTLRPC